MALRTLVEVPTDLEHAFVEVPRHDRMGNARSWDESWPSWAKINPRVPEGTKFAAREELEEFAREQLEKIHGLVDPEKETLFGKLGRSLASLLRLTKTGGPSKPGSSAAAKRRRENFLLPDLLRRASIRSIGSRNSTAPRISGRP